VDPIQLAVEDLEDIAEGTLQDTPDDIYYSVDALGLKVVYKKTIRRMCIDLMS
jgi:hypothetical protein